MTNRGEVSAEADHLHRPQWMTRPGAQCRARGGVAPPTRIWSSPCRVIDEDFGAGDVAGEPRSVGGRNEDVLAAVADRDRYPDLGRREAASPSEGRGNREPGT